MKKFLGIFLALSLMLSLCACSKGNGDVSGSNGESSSPPAGQTQTLGDSELTETDEPAPPKKVTGDRVIMSEEELKAKYMPTDFVIGPVDPDTIITKDRMPLDEANNKISVGAELQDGGIMKFTIISRGDDSAFEIETAKDEMRILTRYFNQDGETYVYVQGSEAEIIAGQMYHIVDEIEEPADGEEPVDSELTEPVEGETAEPVEGGGDMDMSSVVDELAPDGFISVFKDGDVDSSQFTSCEYVGLIGNHHTFEVAAKDGTKCLLLIDHISGWIVGINQTSETEEYKSMSFRVDYNVEDTEVYDVSNAEDINAFEGIMMLFANLMLLGDMGEFGIS